MTFAFYLFPTFDFLFLVSYHLSMAIIGVIFHTRSPSTGRLGTRAKQERSNGLLPPHIPYYTTGLQYHRLAVLFVCLSVNLLFPVFFMVLFMLLLYIIYSKLCTYYLLYTTASASLQTAKQTTSNRFSYSFRSRNVKMP